LGVCSDSDLNYHCWLIHVSNYLYKQTEMERYIWIADKKRKFTNQQKRKIEQAEKDKEDGMKLWRKRIEEEYDALISNENDDDDECNDLRGQVYSSRV